MQSDGEGGRVNAVESGTDNPITEIDPPEDNVGMVFTSSNLDSYRRDEVNKRFETIDNAENNDQTAYGSYTDKNNHSAKAYGWYTKIKNNGRLYVPEGTNGITSLITKGTEENNTDTNKGAVRYCDVYNKFKEMSTHPDFDKAGLTDYVELEPVGRDIKFDGNYYYKKKIEELNSTLGDLSENGQVANYLENTFVTAVTNYYPYIEKTRFWLDTLNDGVDTHNTSEDYPTNDIKIDGEIVLDPFGGNDSAKSWVYELYNKKEGNVTDEKGQKLTDQDQARHVDTIFRRREHSDIVIDCDISKITLKANGNVQTYDYYALKNGLSKPEEAWGSDAQSLHSLEHKIQESLLNGKTGYQRAINESEYLYNASDYDLEDTRNLQVFITYHFVVGNTGDVPVTINEITDYYDSFYLQYFESKDKENIIRDNTNVNANEGSSINPDHKGALNAEVGPKDVKNMYRALYIKIDKKLDPTEYTEGFITFEQTKDSNGRIHLTQDLEKGTILRPDMNIFEVNSYSTANEDLTNPQHGLVTEKSIVGDVESYDFYQNGQHDDSSLYGHIIVTDDPVTNRIEYDTVQAPNVAIFVPKDAQKSTISGKTFEDVRDTTSEEAVIGNGIYDTNNKDRKENEDGTADKDKPINGVTVQLVELIKEVDGNGYSEAYKQGDYKYDKYIGEKIWDTTTYKLEACEKHETTSDIRRWQNPQKTEYIPSEKANEKNDVQRYASGTKSRVILNVEPGAASESYLYTAETAVEDGEYKFENVPPGDFVVRFIYGDTTDTVLVQDNEVTKLLGGELNGYGASPEAAGKTITDHDENKDTYGFLEGTGFLDTKGKNIKSYNGQDYKSTVYQIGYKEDIYDKEAEFKDIKGPNGSNSTTPATNGSINCGDYKDYKNYVMQNYSNTNGIDMMYPKENGNEDDNLKKTLYYFDIEQSDDDKKALLSDAKDIDSFRQNSNNYAKGYISETEYGNIETARQLRQKNSIEGVEDSSVTSGSNNTKENKENGITLRNYRAEVLASWKEIGTYTYGDEYNSLTRLQNGGIFNENQAQMQKEMLIEFMKNTKMVAQTGVIRMESEYNTTSTTMDFDKNMTMQNENFIGKDPGGKPEDLLNYKGDKVQLKEDDYKKEIVDDVDLGLTERPEAQLKLDKRVSNVSIKLASGDTLFDTSKSVNNLYFGNHKGHRYYTKNNRLTKVVIGSNTRSTPELIQAYMDDELIKGATLNVTYEFTVENVGEVDYLDRKFYYMGKTNSKDDWNIARTNADEVLDYVSNNIRFNYDTNSTLNELLVKYGEHELKSEYENLTWREKAIVPAVDGDTKTNGDYYYYYVYPLGINDYDYKKLSTGNLNEINKAVAVNDTKSDNKNDDLVNREYFPDVISYNTLITTKGLSTTKYNPDMKNYESRQQVKYSSYDDGENEDYTEGNTVYSYGLIPKLKKDSKEVDYKIKTQLMLSNTLSEEDQSLVYPNLAEIVRMSNSVGRRAFYSTVGNQPMSNQNYGNDVPSDEKEPPYKKYSKYNPVDVVTPVEIDADSSQSVRILPPTGFNKNNSNLYFAIIGAAAIIIVSISMIKAGLSASRKKKRTKDIKRWM